MTIWSESWRPLDERLERLESSLRSLEVPVYRAGAFDRWDIEARGGWLGTARVRAALEEHGRGRQLVRFRIWPRSSPGAVAVTALLALLALGSGVAGAGVPAVALALLAVVLALQALRDCGTATAALVAAVDAQLQSEGMSSLVAADPPQPSADVVATRPELIGRGALAPRADAIGLMHAKRVPGDEKATP